MTHHQNITDATEDQLSLASMHYLRSHFQEATDIYKRLLIEYREYLSLQVRLLLSTRNRLHVLWPPAGTMGVLLLI